MYLNSGSNYYLIPLENVIIYTQSGLSIKNPNFKIRLLSYAEFKKVTTLIEAKASNTEISDEIFTACFLGILGFEDEVVDFDATPLAIQLIADSIYLRTQQAIVRPEITFNNFLISTNLFDIWCGLVANILNIPFEDVVVKPVDEVIRLYSLAYLVSNRAIAPIAAEEPEKNK